ncbi:acetate/propionate family kinase [Arhodomonas sp. KWT2]|uniref:acetate/propionate family kinase n=1 Tax=unclassified Arhodomonas TaxID=2621637 RepID=UPI00353043C1
MAQWFALPRRYRDQGVLRYGFHGLSYEYIAGALPAYDPAAARGRAVVAHLGHGASLCALSEGRSVATTMGFTALDGLPMGRRCGALDPGVVLHLMRSEGLSADAIEDLLYRHSGLYGVSGISDDMHALLDSDAPAAAEAVALFVYRTVREIGSLAAALGGLDAVVFTAGIGEHAAAIRERVSAGLEWLGARLDHDANTRGGPCISTADSTPALWVIPTDEERMIAEHTLALLRRHA